MSNNLKLAQLEKSNVNKSECRVRLDGKTKTEKGNTVLIILMNKQMYTVGVGKETPNFCVVKVSSYFTVWILQLSPNVKHNDLFTCLITNICAVHPKRSLFLLTLPISLFYVSFFSKSGKCSCHSHVSYMNVGERCKLKRCCQGGREWYNALFLCISLFIDILWP